MTAGIVNIRGKAYRTVAYRVTEFRDLYPIDSGWSIETAVVESNADVVVMQAIVKSPGGRVVATGWAEEARTRTGINSTSAVENCETSCIGRALSACGFGGSEYASANEVEAAIEQSKDDQSWTKDEEKRFKAVIKKWGWTMATLREFLKEQGSRRPDVGKWSQTTRNRLLSKLEHKYIQDSAELDRELAEQPKELLQNTIT